MNHTTAFRRAERAALRAVRHTVLAETGVDLDRVDPEALTDRERQALERADAIDREVWA